MSTVQSSGGLGKVSCQRLDCVLPIADGAASVRNGDGRIGQLDYYFYFEVAHAADMYVCLDSRGSLMRRTGMTNGAARLDELHEQVTGARKMCGGYFVSTMHRRRLVFTHHGLAMLNGITASQTNKGVSEVAGYDHLCSRNGRMAKMCPCVCIQAVIVTGQRSASSSLQPQVCP